LRLVIDNANGTGDGACAGCVPQVVMWLIQIELKMADGSPTITLTAPVANGSDAALMFWQSSLPDGCYSRPDPARTSTWGSIKSLYR